MSKDSSNSQSSHDQSNKEASGFFYKKNVIKGILYAIYICCTALVAIEFFIHRHIYTEIESIPAFYAIYGFVASILLVLICKWVRIVLIRDENYYDEPETPEEFLSKPTNITDSTSEGNS